MGRRPGPVEAFRAFAIELEVAATRRRAIDPRWDTLALRNADGNDSLFEVRPIEDFLEMLGLNVAKLKPMVKDSGLRAS